MLPKSVFGLQQIQEILTAKGIVDEHNFESESSIQDCQSLRAKFNTDVLERAWISSEFKCKACGRQFSIVDLFNSEVMKHSPEMIKSIWESPNPPTLMHGNDLTTQLTCDCGHTDSYDLPGFVVKLKDRADAIQPMIHIYLRKGKCYHNN